MTFHPHTLVRNLMVLCATALVFSACTDDTFGDGLRRVEEGIPTTLTLRFDADERTAYTRSDAGSVTENTVQNLYILIFDEHGNKRYGQLHPITKDNITQGTPNVTGHVTIKTESLNNATIAGIANVMNVEGEGVSNYDITKDLLEAVQTLDDLQKLTTALKTETVERITRLLMSGYAEDNNNPQNTKINIKPKNDGTVTNLACTLKLRRTDAKLKFDVKFDTGGKNWSDPTFIPGEWMVKRIPRASLVLQDANGNDYGSTATEPVYFDMTREMPFEQLPNKDNGQTASFTFYMPENLRAPKQEIPADAGDANARYALRDKYTTDEGNGKKTFTYAADNATYVEMTGALSYIDNNHNGIRVSADVKLTVHLGYAVPKGSQTAGDPNDYNTRRNGDYTYTVTIRGVDDIVVRVTQNNDRRPGYEGDVIYTEGDGLFEFDAHYDRRVIKLHKNAIGPGMKWAVSTPFSRGVQLPVSNPTDPTQLPVNMRDYRWIKFAVNAQYGLTGASKEKFVKYPGDQNYNDPFAASDAENNQPSPYYDPSSPYYGQQGDYSKARLMDVNQLILFLQDEKKKLEMNQESVFEDDGCVYISAFVDEYVYIIDPTAHTARQDLKLWKRCVDTDDRVLHIIANNADGSTGGNNEFQGNSSLLKSTYTFKQHSIRTIYDTGKQGLDKIWGLETKMEEIGNDQDGRLPTGDVTNGTSKSNGRANTVKCVLGEQALEEGFISKRKWTEVMNTDKYYDLNAGYADALHACLIRNRDLNGNNIVEPREIRWYLASINQLTEMYIGENALDEEARLYPDSKRNASKPWWHYTSSSSNTENTGTNNTNPAADSWILWAEEGASRGSSLERPDEYKDYLGDKFAYRCVRNLGIDLNDETGEPEPLITGYKEAGGYIVIDMTNLNPKARRTAAASSFLNSHDERSVLNRPYAKFRVHPQTRPTPQYSPRDRQMEFTNALSWSEGQTYTQGVQTGYRTPSQRELLIMSIYIPQKDWEDFEGRDYINRRWTSKARYLSCTGFSMNGKNGYGSNRYGWIYSAIKNNFLLTHDWDGQWIETGFASGYREYEYGFIRPVQDVIE